MKTRKIMAALLAGAAFASLAYAGSPAFAEWTVVQNHADPFEPSKSTFIAGTIEQEGSLAIRCLQGRISLVVVSGPSNATPGQSARLKIVADSRPPRDENNSVVMGATDDSTAVQFGDETTLNYLNGAQKVSMRYYIGEVITTDTFSGGTPLADVIQAALKACGK